MYLSNKQHTKQLNEKYLGESSHKTCFAYSSISYQDYLKQKFVILHCLQYLFGIQKIKVNIIKAWSSEVKGTFKASFFLVALGKIQMHYILL